MSFSLEGSPYAGGVLASPGSPSGIADEGTSNLQLEMIAKPLLG